MLTDLRQAKAVSLTGLSKQHRTSRFRRFVNSAALDRFLLVGARPIARWECHCVADRRAAQECQAYVDLKFGDVEDQGEDAEDDSSRAQSSHQSELDTRMKSMAQAYAFILMKEGYNYQQIHNEKIFFEAFYDFTVRVTNQRFGPRLW